MKGEPNTPPTGTSGLLVKGADLKALRDTFLQHVTRLRFLATLEWTYPSGEREDLKTYVFPSSNPKLIVAPADWGHYISVLLNVPDRVVADTPEVETNTPMLELYLPKGKPTWRPNFIFCSAGAGRIELRCYGKFKVGARGGPATKFFRFVKHNKPSMPLKLDHRGKLYAALGPVPTGQPAAWNNFWGTLAAFAAVVRSYKQH
jgi:hypothetical protein